MTRIIICGGREWADRTPMLALFAILTMGPTALCEAKDLLVVHGDQRGADRLADQVARLLGVRTEPHPADWKQHGKAAGPIRNREMLGTDPHAVYAFKDGFDTTLASGGTENMVKLARGAGVGAYVYSDGGWLK